jgi:hypothetical protein
MLKKVSQFLAAHDNTVSVISRTQSELNALKQEAMKSEGKINPLALDYRDQDNLKEQLEDAIAEFGGITLVVNWMHSDAIDSSEIIAEVLNRTSPFCRYFQVLPSEPDDVRRGHAYYDDPFKHLDKVLYRKIILGIADEDGVSRWLSDDEISNGIIDALRNDRKDAVIGSMDASGKHTQSA